MPTQVGYTRTPIDLNLQIHDYIGNGVPTTALANAAVGSLYRQLDGGSGSTLWQKTSAGSWEPLQSSSWSQAAADARYLRLTGGTLSGTLTLNAQLVGAFGATTTGGVLDWNDSTNARTGNGVSLLLGTATNGPGGASYYHPLTFEYSATKDGTGNLTQFAIPYAADTTNMYMRGRYAGTWGSWFKFVTSGNVSSYIDQARTWTTVQTFGASGLIGSSYFSSYVADGVFGATALPAFKSTTPGGASRNVIVGYNDAGGNEYMPSVGFLHQGTGSYSLLPVIQNRLSGQSNNLFQVAFTGRLSWGPGSAVVDVYLERGGTGYLIGKGAWRIGTASSNTGFASPTSGGLDVMVGSGTDGFQVWDDNTLTSPRFKITRSGDVLGNGSKFQFGILDTGRSGGDYPRLGYNFNVTGTSGSYTYRATDNAAVIIFGAGGSGSGFQFQAASGTVGGAISFSTLATFDIGSYKFFGNLAATNEIRAGAYAGGGHTPGDITARRSATTGVYYFGDYSDRYLYFDGTSFLLSGGTLSASDFVLSSDMRKKRNVSPMLGALDRVSRLEGFTFEFETDTRRRAGVSAQAVKEVLPEAVYENADGSLGVAYDSLVPLLIEAVKELKLALQAQRGA